MHNRATGANLRIGSHAGGVMCVRSGTVSIKDSNFIHNMAIRSGGVMQVENSTIEIEGSSFESNRARSYGGVADSISYSWRLRLPSTFSVIQSSFTSNEAFDGGVFYLRSDGSNVYISESSLSLNHAFDEGGVFSVEGISLTVENTSIYNNMALQGNTIDTCNSNITVESNETHYYDISQNTQAENCFYYDLIIRPIVKPSTTTPLFSSTTSVVSTIPLSKLTSTISTETLSTFILHSISPTKVSRASSIISVSSTAIVNLRSTPTAVTVMETITPTMMTTTVPTQGVTETSTGDELNTTDYTTYATVVASNGIKLHPKLLIFVFTLILTAIIIALCTMNS